jgi:hypothetical protein
VLDGSRKGGLVKPARERGADVPMILLFLCLASILAILRPALRCVTAAG